MVTSWSASHCCALFLVLVHLAIGWPVAVALEATDSSAHHPRQLINAPVGVDTKSGACGVQSECLHFSISSCSNGARTVCAYWMPGHRCDLIWSDSYPDMCHADSSATPLAPLKPTFSWKAYFSRKVCTTVAAAVSDPKAVFSVRGRSACTGSAMRDEYSSNGVYFLGVTQCEPSATELCDLSKYTDESYYNRNAQYFAENYEWSMLINGGWYDAADPNASRPPLPSACKWDVSVKQCPAGSPTRLPTASPATPAVPTVRATAAPIGSEPVCIKQSRCIDVFVGACSGLTRQVCLQWSPKAGCSKSPLERFAQACVSGRTVSTLWASNNMICRDLGTGSGDLQNNYFSVTQNDGEVCSGFYEESGIANSEEDGSTYNQRCTPKFFNRDAPQCSGSSVSGGCVWNIQVPVCSLSTNTLAPSSTPSKPATGTPSSFSLLDRPSTRPSAAPNTPSKQPTKLPTKLPTPRPSEGRTVSTGTPTTLEPTTNPTKAPTTKSPTSRPSEGRTVSTGTPTTLEPTTNPTKAPTTKSPTRSPNNSPTVSTRDPTRAPTTKDPTKAPSKLPTTRDPTRAPTTKDPTKAPSKLPTTRDPTRAPTTRDPTPAPTTRAPTRDPTPDPNQDGETIIPRKEFRQVTNAEWQAFAAAVNVLERNRIWGTYAEVHSVYFTSGIHGGSQFWPWHREYLRAIETELKNASPTPDLVNLHYWDWTQDSSNLANAPLFTSNRYGEFPPNGGCLQNGAFAGFSAGNSPENSCITRTTRSRVGGGPDLAEVIQALETDNYDSARFNIENLHNFIHSTTGAGGTMGGALSPMDPMFYAHHMFVDILWSEWQFDSIRTGNHDAYGGNTATALSFYGEADPQLSPFNPWDTTALISNNNPDFNSRTVADTMHYHMVPDGTRRRLSKEGQQVRYNSSHPALHGKSEMMKNIADKIDARLKTTQARELQAQQHNRRLVSERREKQQVPKQQEQQRDSHERQERQERAQSAVHGRQTRSRWNRSNKWRRFGVGDEQVPGVEYKKKECSNDDRAVDMGNKKRCVTFRQVKQVLVEATDMDIPRLCPPPARIPRTSPFWTPGTDALYEKASTRFALAKRLWGNDRDEWRLQTVDTTCLDLDFMQEQFQRVSSKHGPPKREDWQLP